MLAPLTCLYLFQLLTLQDHTEPVDLIKEIDYPDEGVGIEKVPSDHRGTIVGEHSCIYVTWGLINHLPGS